jgi:3-oxoacyl-[acyl-carrier protein] reductase
LTSGLAREVASKGIRVNGVAPSWTDTEMLRMADADHVAKRASHIAIGRVAKPEEIAAAVSALVRPDMTYMIGQTIVLDGGGMT